MERSQRIRELFDRVVDLPLNEREAILRSSGEDPSVLDEVRDLLVYAGTGNDGGVTTKDAAQRYAHLAKVDEPSFAEFEIIRKEGAGGQGTVYLAYDHQNQRKVAIKVLGLHYSGSTPYRKRFVLEAAVGELLEHPAIVPVYGRAQQGGIDYIIMKYIEGATLADLLALERGESPKNPAAADRPVPWAGVADPERSRRVSGMLAEVADGLHHAHKCGIVHRDVKPSNILIDNSGRAHITDFGIAKVKARPAMTEPGGRVPGTLPYMSPEQVRSIGIEIDHRTDIFSLGVVLYEATAGRLPFEKTSEETSGEAIDKEVSRKILECDPDPIRRVNPRIPADLARICHRALEKHPADRFDSADEFASELRRYSRSQKVSCRASAPRRWIRKQVRKRAKVLAGSIVLLLCLALMWALVANGLRTRWLKVNLEIEVPASAVVNIERFNTNGTLSGVVRTLKPHERRISLDPGLYRIVVRFSEGVAEATALLVAGEAFPVIRLNLPHPEDINKLRFVPGGRYQIGPPDVDTPPRHVMLDPFLISPTEVTNAEYRVFVMATSYAPPRTWAVPYNPADDNLPVTGISWDDANAYCRWRGVRLPTPLEWEAAARGPDARLYPWGDQVRDDLLVVDTPIERPIRERYLAGARAVNVDGHPTPSGLMHMCSNVQEYTEGIAWDRDGAVIVKGRSWRDLPSVSLAAIRSVAGASGRSLHASDRGFRVAFTVGMENKENSK